MRRLLLPLLLLVSTAPAAAATSPDPFPVYPAIEGSVRFWVRVFGELSTTEVAVHDADRPGLIYEVVPLPGAADSRYSAAQRAFVDQLAETWRGRLRALEQKVAAGQPLDDAEKALALAVATAAGSEALRGAADRVRTQRGVRERFLRGLERAQRYDGLIRQVLREEGVPEDLAYLPHVESSFETHAVSSAGAVGVWQFTRSAARRFMQLGTAIDERLDPIAAARGAARYLRDAHAKLGRWSLAITSYNHGVGGMSQAVAQHGRDYEQIFLEYRGRLFGFASRNFYPEFLAAREVASHPERYFPEGLTPEPPLDHDRLVLDRPATPRTLARRYGVSVERLASINPAWTRRAVRSDLSLPANTIVWLPRGSFAAAAGGRAADHATAGAGTDHVVRAGDTLSSIARRHGITVDQLRALNDFDPHRSLLHVGQRLRVEGSPAASATASAALHVVEPGETLMRIAVRYGVGLADLLLVNRLDERAVIHPGQRLRIPVVGGTR